MTGGAGLRSGNREWHLGSVDRLVEAELDLGLQIGCDPVDGEEQIERPVLLGVLGERHGPH